jgi:hypothetical protein
MVAVVQTAGDLGHWHPHVHAVVSRGGWTRDWRWVPVPYVDEHSAELLFRHKVIRLLQDEGLLSEERTELLLSWRHTGFSVHNRVRVEPEDNAGVERLGERCHEKVPEKVPGTGLLVCLPQDDRLVSTQWVTPSRLRGRGPGRQDRS